MIRVLTVHCEFRPQSSGVARHIEGLSRALLARGDIEPVILAQNLVKVPDDYPGPVDAGGFGRLLPLIRTVDVVHVHGSRTGISALALRLARWLGKPVVFTPHCYYQGGTRLQQGLKRGWDLLVERGTVRGADAVILLHSGWSQVMQDIGLRGRREEIIPNCLDADALMARLQQAGGRRLSGAPAILSVGRLDPVKRLDDGIRALTECGMEQAEFHIVGQGADRERLEALAMQCGVAARVHFHGWQDDASTAAMMKGCDVMLLASEREGLPTVLLESLLAGVPMAISDIEGNRAIADVVGWPFRFPVGDGAALARCVADCVVSGVDPAVREAVLQQFSWQSRANEVAALYLDLLRQRGRCG